MAHGRIARVGGVLAALGAAIAVAVTVAGDDTKGPLCDGVLDGQVAMVANTGEPVGTLSLYRDGVFACAEARGDVAADALLLTLWRCEGSDEDRECVPDREQYAEVMLSGSPPVVGPARVLAPGGCVFAAVTAFEGTDFVASAATRRLPTGEPAPSCP